MERNNRETKSGGDYDEIQCFPEAVNAKQLREKQQTFQ